MHGPGAHARMLCLRGAEPYIRTHTHTHTRRTGVEAGGEENEETGERQRSAGFKDPLLICDRSTRLLWCSRSPPATRGEKSGEADGGRTE